MFEEAVSAIRSGGVIAFATDTVWGLGCDPQNQQAVQRIYDLKSRPDDLELNILAGSVDEIVPLVEFNPLAATLASEYWPGPLSIVLPVGARPLAIPRRGNTLMVRIPQHSSTLELLRQTGPMASTSANRHGEAPAKSAAEVARMFGEEIDCVVEGAPGGELASTIIDCSTSPWRILREGPIRDGALRAFLEARQAVAHAIPTFADKRFVHEVDPELAELMDGELRRQEDTLELIPSENLPSLAVFDALGSWLNNKYAEGVPGKRYYGGCEWVDRVENLARDRATSLFGADHANVQPHSGSNANMAVYAAVLQPGDTVMGMALDQGGHLTHGSPVSFSGKLYNFTPYLVDETTGLLDYDQLRTQALEVKPKMIVAGYSSYPRTLDFEKFGSIAKEVGAYLLVDMAHFAGLVAGGVHPSPVPHADFVTMTTHKTLRGPWGGLILCKAEFAAAIDKSVMPGTQGGPQNHTTAAKAVMLKQCATPEFRAYAKQVVVNAKALAGGLIKRDQVLVTGGTDNHLMVLDLRPLGHKGRQVQSAFDEAGITLNANAFPGHGGSPFNPNGVRLGTPSITSRGMGVDEMDEVATLVDTMLRHLEDAEVQSQVRAQSLALCRRFPLDYRHPLTA